MRVITTELTEKYEIKRVFNKSMDLMKPHNHHHYEIFLFLKGNLYYMVNTEKYFIEDGDILLIPPLEVHYPIIEKNLKINRITLSINKDYLETLSSSDTDLARCFNDNVTPLKKVKPSANEYSKILNLFEYLIITESKSFYGQDLLREATLIQLLVLINSSFYNNNLYLDNFIIEKDSLVNEIANYLSKNFNENITLESLEETFYLSKYHLSRRFKDVMGTSIYNFILEKRIEHAKKLIFFELPLNQISINCGFEDYSNFYRAFKKIVGISPKEFKDKIKNKF